MNAPIEHRSFDVEMRAGRVAGIAMTYGDIAELGRGVVESFIPGSLRPESVKVNVAHGPEIVSDAPEVRDDGKRVEISFPATERVKQLVRDGYNRMSIEFRAVRESFDAINFRRTIREAVLSGVALVERPAYPQTSVELRGAWKRALDQGAKPSSTPWVRGSVPTGTVCDCECIAPVTKVSFLAGAFRGMVAAVKQGHTVTAVIGNRGPHNVIGSTSSNMLLSFVGGAAIGSIVGGKDEPYRKGGFDESEPEPRAAPEQLLIEIDSTAANTPGGKSLIDSDAIAPAVIRPLIDHEHELTEWEDVGDTRVYSSAFFRTLLVKAAPERRGWRGLEWWQPDADDQKSAPEPWWALI